MLCPVSMVRALEGASICVSFQSSNAFDGGLSRISLTKWIHHHRKVNWSLNQISNALKFYIWVNALYITACDCVLLCSLIGAVLIVCGLYLLLWGKSKETRKVESEIVSAKGPVKCDSIHISNEKKATSVAPVTSTTLNNTSGEV